MLINQDFTQEIASSKSDRSTYIGGSDIGAILGLSKYRTPLQVWQEKVGKVISKADSLSLRFGSFAESFIADEYVKSTGKALLHDESIYTHPEYSYFCAHLDRLVLGNGENHQPTKILECKTASAFARSDWGEIGSDEVPMSYLAQCAWYMAITGIEQTDLAVLFGNHEFRIYEINKDLQLEKLIIEKAKHFWNEHVLKDIPPPPISEADCQALFATEEANKSVIAGPETVALVEHLQLLNQDIASKEVEVSTIKQRIMEQMADAQLLTDGERVLATWKSPKLSYRLDSKRLELELPKVYEQYKAPIQNSRRLVIKNTINN